ncbi:hypothetical protein L3Q82_020097 [Scortum barcoo]|uniref:Uncharacterized protein n=1 Tax=Scortum barcoo TaxID=214431 RepID=A0ACB8VDK2_9TELE|nr:hypothetical protein L3Q82_020097 [Scortum barcoo]
MLTESGENGREDRPGAAALSAGHLPPQSPQESLQHHQIPLPPPAHILCSPLPSGRRALLEALTTGSSLRRASSEAEYFFRSNTSRSFSDDSKMKTRADH